MKEHIRVIKRATIACALGAALLGPTGSRPTRAGTGVNGPLLAIVGMQGEGGVSPHFSLVAVAAGGVTVLARQTPNTFAGLAPSPRGRYVAIAGGTSGLWEADADGSHLRRVLSPPASHGDGDASVPAVTWSPDRYTLAYALAGTREADGLYLARYDGAGRHRLASAARLSAAIGPRVRELAIRRLSWSADGRTIAASIAGDTIRGNGFTVLLVDAAAGRVRASIPGRFDASFSPTAPVLAYLGPAPARDAAASEGFTLTVADATGRRPRALFSTHHFVEGPVWSPDGASLAYTWSPETVEKSYVGGAEIHAVDVATGAARTIATGSGPELRGQAFIGLAWLHARE